MRAVALPRPDGADWTGLTPAPLPVEEASTWAVVAGCGAVVSFTGTVRDRAEGRTGVTLLEYEAYEEVATDRLRHVAAEARRRWPAIGRLALLHRVGPLAVGEAAVLVVVSTPHRDEAFEAARWCIDTVKATVPLWKREVWDGGQQEDWGTGAVSVGEMPSGGPAS
ncbi:MAG: molybdenum cofactor biosynthesis protein MoaE [Acidimicrobiales bacterium]